MTLKEYLYITDDVVHLQQNDLWYYHTSGQDALLNTKTMKKLCSNIDPDYPLIEQLHLHPKVTLELSLNNKVIYHEKPAPANPFEDHIWLIRFYEATPDKKFEYITYQIQCRRTFDTNTFGFITTKRYMARPSNQTVWNTYTSHTEMMIRMLP